ncbi:acyl-CoA dehydrogenase [Pandoraea captiosa]|uniref:Acyl-coenzyme A dehydrogenase n=1 Tax=Pandoraea captiosa TaxID=2508302 RepID=A0A5E4ZMF1_9BURK|nr:acyl-CoA dehydrogenase [Pandoraea captiosa]
MAVWIVAFVVGVSALLFYRAHAWQWLIATVLWVGVGVVSGLTGALAAAVLGIAFILPALILSIGPLRRAWITAPMLAKFRTIMPEMSDTEKDAIEAGTVWWDADLFSGQPDWRKFAAMPAPALSAEEQAFMDNQVEHLCDLSNDWESTQVWQDLPPKAWQYAKEAGFLGMIIPKRYGGLEFSAYAHSQVVMKLASRCSAAAVSVMVPNSLGPAELLLHYGTQAQKDHYLPRLARGEEIPCFALTSPYAGSDAAAIPDVGIVCRGMHEGRETLGFRVTWNKRYITLGPIATVLGLAFRALDPEHLLGDDDAPGITCALIPTTHPGVVIGRRHWPLNAVFQNGPNSGTDVFIPIDWVIGGQAQVGKGWRMLMECLAAGRAISLPSSNVGYSKIAVRATGAYAAVRRQFRTPIGKFEGVQEALARMAGNLYAMDATRRMAALAVDLGEKPSVISAIAKYHVTERARKVVNDGMDVVAGKGICMGPNNFLARAYQQIPVSITVEGANIMTRCLMIFGQGAIRCHPYVLKELAAAQMTDENAAVRAFDDALFGHLTFVTSNIVRGALQGVTHARFSAVPSGAAPELRSYYRAANRMSTLLAIAADISMAVLGGSLKRRESITGRLGDILSQLFVLSATLKRFEDEGRPEADLPLVHWAAQDALWQAREAFEGVLANYPSRGAAWWMRWKLMPFGLPYAKPSDALSARVAQIMQTPGDARERLIAGSYSPSPEVDALAYGEIVFQMTPEVTAIEQRLRTAIKDGHLPVMPQSLPEFTAWVAHAAQSQRISDEERRLLAQYADYAAKAVAVDDFPADFGRAADMQQARQHAPADEALTS